MKHHFIPTGKAIVKKPVWARIRRNWSPYTLLVIIGNNTATMKNHLTFLRSLNIKLHYDPPTSLK